MIDILPEPLLPLAAYRQFILVKLQKNSDNGKFDKRPVHYETGRMINAQDPSSWTDYVTAIAAAKKFGQGYCIGFVFTENDPFWFLDIDNCLVEGGIWSPMALQLCRTFSGAAVEVSSSNKGLHIFGKYSHAIPPHRCKNSDLQLEFYTEKRFVALTGFGISGNIATDFTGILRDFIPKYFPKEIAQSLPVIAANSVSQLTDEQVIEKALNSKPTVVLLGGAGVTFADLWEVNEDTLSKKYPGNNGSSYDASSADSALAFHLAFWCAKDSTQMKRLMRASGLCREKYDRVDYLDRTIQNACTRQQNIYRESRSSKVKTEQATESNVPEPESGSNWQEVDIARTFTHPPQPPQFLIEQLLPSAVLTLLGAHGGAGKSMLALQAAVCLAIGRPFMGKTVKQSRVLFFSAEDSGITVQFRLARICRQFGVEPITVAGNLKIIDATNDPCLYGDMPGQPRCATITVGYQRLKAMVADFGADILVIDNASDTFDANENERARVRQFVRVLLQLGGKHKATVLLIAHVDKQTAKGMGNSEGYSGSTAWHNSARSRLFLTAKEDKLVLEHQKSNFGCRAEPIYLNWTIDGVLEHVMAINEQDSTKVVFSLIAKSYERGDSLSPSINSRNNVYKVLSAYPEFPKLLTREQLLKILCKAEGDGYLVREEYKNESRKTKCRYKLAPSAPG